MSDFKDGNGDVANQDSDFSDFDIAEINLLRHAFLQTKNLYGTGCQKKEWYKACVDFGTAEKPFFLMLWYKKSKSGREDVFLYSEEPEEINNDYVGKISFIKTRKETEVSGDYKNIRSIATKHQYPKFKNFRNMLLALEEKMGYTSVEKERNSQEKEFSFPKFQRQH